jgi:hypothetical protein
LTLLRHSELHGMHTLFRGITKNVPSQFRGIFSERNFDGNPTPSPAGRRFSVVMVAAAALDVRLRVQVAVECLLLATIADKAVVASPTAEVWQDAKE